MNDLEIISDEQWNQMSMAQKNQVLASITNTGNIQELRELKNFLEEKVAIANARPDDSAELEELRNITKSMKADVEKEVVDRFEKMSELKKQIAEDTPEGLNENMDVKELENRKIAIKKNLNIIYKRMISTAESLDLSELSKATVEQDLLPSFYK